ncbi:MAG: phospholipid carrier-dependent glycosyltransferase [Candidatus Omnitrophica bacterium]|nr:phospholipid carrier-dependent glycosyltransferase [Candidatus Omnitrophota bacterium]
MINIIKKISIWYALLGLAVILGIGLRLYGLNRSGIFFYDEAMYLSHSLPILELIEHFHPTGDSFWQAMAGYIKAPLAFTKPIWILIVDSRYFFTQVHDWDYAKYASCLFGVLTLPLTFFFARRFFDSVPVACLSTAFLSLLPGHIFYSRLGLQEAFSAFVVLAGFYCYLFARDLGKRTVLAGLFLCMAYLANYRLIVLPLLLVLTEVWLGIVCKEGIRWRHLVWACMTFLIVMVLVGCSMGGTQMYYSFAWIFHQQQMAVAKRMWSEVFAYPYYLFRLENVLLAGAFFSSAYFLLKREWKMAWPLIICCAQMLLFTTATDRGARYIAVILPFMVMGAAAVIFRAYEGWGFSWKKFALAGFLACMFIGLVVKAMPLVLASSDYKTSVEYLMARDIDARFLSTQDIVQRLYVQDRSRVRPVPLDFGQLLQNYAQGYRYLILDSQAYISFPSNEYKWALPLKGYMSFVDRYARPQASFAHFNKAVMERVVFEHSDNLFQSIRFLDSPELLKMSSLRIYDLRILVPVLSEVAKGKSKP